MPGPQFVDIIAEFGEDLKHKESIVRIHMGVSGCGSLFRLRPMAWSNALKSWKGWRRSEHRRTEGRVH